MVGESAISDGTLELAETLLDVVPLVMGSIRTEMRAHRKAELSVPQFRVLNFLHFQGTASLSNIAEHIGQTSPSMSAMIDGLASRGLVSRELNNLDRRKVAIEITPKGKEAWESAWKATCHAMADRLRRVDLTRRQQLSGGLRTLRSLFGS